MLTEELKEELDIQELIEKLGGRKIKTSSSRISMCCLHPKHDDRSPSMMYRFETKTFKCYSCGWGGDAIELIKETYDLKFIEAVDWLKDFAGWTGVSDSSKVEAILDKRSKLYKEVENDSSGDIVLPIYFERDFGLAGDPIQSYVRKRRWSETLLGAYNIGYCSYGYFSDRIIFPVYNSDGSLRSFAARTIHADIEPRYQYPEGTKIGELVWGLNKKIKGVPVFVEGITDALRLRQYGINSFAVLGNQLGNTKLELIRREFKNGQSLIVVPDNDEGGNILLGWFQKLVHDFRIDVGLINGGNDIDELDQKSVTEILKSTKLLSQYQVEYYLEGTNGQPSVVDRVVRE